MPFWSRSKGSPASSSSPYHPAEHHQRSVSRQAFAARGTPSDPFPTDYKSPVQRPLQQYRAVSPEIPSTHIASASSHSNDEDPHFLYQDNSSNPSLGLREPDSKKGGLREKPGLRGASREALTELAPETSKTTPRRKLSTKIRDQPTFQRYSGADYSPQSNTQSPSLRRDLHLPDPRKESDSIRDLADFFRTTGPSSDPRRPLSYVGTSSKLPSKIAENPLEPQRSRSEAEEPSHVGFSIESEDPVQVDREGLFQEKGLERFPPRVQSIGYHTYHEEAQPSDVDRDQELQRPPSSFSRPQSEQELERPLGSISKTGSNQDRPVEYIDRPHPVGLRTTASVRETSEGVFIEAGEPKPDRSGMPGHTSLQPPRGGSAEHNEPPTPSMIGKGAPTPSPVPRRGSVSQHNDMGRRTPPPPRTAVDMSEQDVSHLIADHRELREKYSKVKRYFFEKEGQVQQLQNAIAHQRLSQSRTSLDDGEYVARLTRLDGLIAQLAFGFRKDWKTVPAWLQQSINKDAVGIGKQEMTAVGRAFISQWLVEQVFERFFHPALSLEVSQELKAIQLNLRKYSPTLQMGEEEEALTTKIINWRLATIDGLQPVLNAPEANGHRQQLIEILNAELVSSLHAHMNDPPPVGIEGGVHMIVELVVAILGHLPSESRDVNIEYYTPGMMIHPDFMKIESGIPALNEPIATLEVTEDDEASNNINNEEKESLEGQSEESEQQPKERGKKGFFGGLIGKKSSGAGPLRHGSASASSSSLMQPPGSAGGAKEEQPPRVRLCVFPGLQIRDKMILAKAPVFRS